MVPLQLANPFLSYIKVKALFKANQCDVGTIPWATEIKLVVLASEANKS